VISGGERIVDCAFDPILIQASRLAILVCLAHGEPMSFMELRKRTGLADGNLHVQTGKLARAELIITWKEPAGKRNRTLFRVTDTGRRRLRTLIARLELSLEQPPTSSFSPGEPRRGDDSRVW